MSPYTNEMPICCRTFNFKDTLSTQGKKDKDKTMKKKGKKQVPNCVPVDEEIVTEIGDSSIKPYKFQEVDRAGQFTYVRFTTDNATEYEVVLEKTTFKDPANKDGYIARAMGIEFLAKKKGAEGYSAKITTNEGDVLKIMSTVSAIIKK